MASKTEKKFPKGFKKQRFSSIDWKFSLIVLLSFLFHVVAVLYFKAHLPRIIELVTADKVQHHYANLLLDRAAVPPAPLPASGREAYLPPLTGDEAAVPVAASGTGAPGSRPSAGGGAAGGVPGGGGGGSGGAGGGEGGGTGGGGGGAGAGAVGNIGLLGILTSGSGYVASEYINGITNYGDAENARLGRVLSALDGVSARSGHEGRGYGSGYGSGGGNPAGDRKTRGTRRTSRGLTVDALIDTLGSTGEVAFTQIGRAYDGFEQVGEGGGSMRAGDSAGEGTGQRLRRDPEFVQNIINRHRKAITDCYKRVLRTNPNKKGKVEVRFTINPLGRVSSVEIISSTLTFPGLEECVLTRIRHWNDFGPGDPAAPDEVYRQVFTFGY